MDLGDWLRGVGLERYEPAFRENEINEKVLPSLTAEDLGVVISDTAVCCSPPLRPCALMQARKHHHPQRLANGQRLASR